jgi:hypothetical protein
MTRDMRLANQRVFRLLEEYCSRREDPVLGAGKVRWISSTPQDKQYLKGLTVAATVSFGSRRSLAHLVIDEQHFIALTDFEFPAEIREAHPVEPVGGLIVALLSEVLPTPTSSPSEVRNVVEVGSKEEPEYAGHDVDSVARLFPTIQVLECVQPLAPEALWRLFLVICTDECRLGGSWIDDALARSLVTLATLEVPALPYAAICRSIFDADPRSLFMALYRCIEATYAYDSSNRIITALGLQTSWPEMAAALDAEIGWHPQEAAALNAMLEHALEQDLEELCYCLKAIGGREPHVRAGRALYALRNRVVHYRAGTVGESGEDIDWNRLCEALIGIVVDVFTRAYT